MHERYTVGVDLGQANDYTAITVLEQDGSGEAAGYAVRHLERFPLGTAYPAQVERIKALLRALRGSSGGAADLVVDQTGVGRPVIDILKAAALKPIAVTITGGDAVSRDRDEYRVPKRDLVSTVQVLLQGGRLKIAKALPHAQTLVDELLGFKVRVSVAGHDSYGNDVGAWREAQHDDLVLSVALAAWHAETRKPLQIFL